MKNYLSVLAGLAIFSVTGLVLTVLFFGQDIVVVLEKFKVASLIVFILNVLFLLESMAEKNKMIIHQRNAVASTLVALIVLLGSYYLL